LFTYIISLIASYLIGSIPTAFLVVKNTSKVDIRTVGSGNVGGRNALEVTGKKWVGVVVTLIDLTKGVLSVLIASMLFEDKVTAASAAMFGSVLGHCYPVWLKFHGGRGLATGAGALFATGWITVPLWLAAYFISERFTKNVHASSVIAIVAIPIGVWLTPASVMSLFLPGYFPPADFLIAGIAMTAVCLTRHIEPLKEYFNAK